MHRPMLNATPNNRYVAFAVELKIRALSSVRGALHCLYEPVTVNQVVLIS